jgi:ribosomal protein L35
MPGKAKPGKIRTASGAKKRIRKTKKGKYVCEKAAHNHLLGQKSKRQKRLHHKKMMANNPVYGKQLKRLLPGV